jgi:hypothetical protein
VFIPKCLNSKWSQRRIVYTKDDLYICYVGEDIIRDFIPLAEIDGIQETHEKGDGMAFTTSFARKKPVTRIQKWPSIDLREKNSVIVSTIEDGFNSGRRYYMQLDSINNYTSLIDDLQKLSAEAARIARGRALFQQSQIALKRLLDSTPFKYFASFLVVAVSAPVRSHAQQ